MTGTPIFLGAECRVQLPLTPFKQAQQGDLFGWSLCIETMATTGHTTCNKKSENFIQMTAVPHGQLPPQKGHSPVLK